MSAEVRQKQQYASLSVLGGTALIAVILRVIARAKSKAKFGFDDGFILGALVFFMSYVSLSIWGASKAESGVDYALLPYPILVKSLKVLYADTLLTVLTISCAKLSVLCLYYRLFSVRREFRIALITVATVSVLWMLACFLLGIWRCVPVRAAWDPLVKGKCYSLQYAFLVSESINCVVDFIIVCMPLPIISQLHLPTRHKFSVSLIFLAGGFVCITSIIRIIFTYHPKNSEYAIFGSSLWCTIQLSFAIMCACLPTYKPILPKGSALTTSLRRFYSRFMSSHGQLSEPYPSAVERDQDMAGDRRPRYGLYNKFDDGATENITLTDIEAVEQGSTHEMHPNDGIKVRSDVHVV